MAKGVSDDTESAPTESVFDNMFEEFEGEESGADDPERYIESEIPPDRSGKLEKVETRGPRKRSEEEDDEEDDEVDDEGEEEEEDEDSAEEEEDNEDKKADLRRRTGDIDPDHEVSVKIDGKEKKVPLREAIEGYIRTETFHTRLNELRDVSMSVQAESARVSETRQKYADLLKTLEEQVNSLTPPEPDWDQVAKEQGHEAAFNQKRQWEKFASQMNSIKEEQTRVAKEQEESRIEDLKNYVVGERHKMMKAVPSWNDDKVRRKDMDAMNKTAKSAGFTDDEINTVYDHRMMLLLRKAALYDRVMARKPKPNGEQIREEKPGAGAPRTAPKTTPRARTPIQRLAPDATSIDIAANAFAKELANEARRARRK